jgi:2'-5' RNA ligase
MAKERLKSPRARLFVALDLPDAVLSGIEAWGEAALGDPALRPLPASALHVTLVFLGYRPEKEIGRLAEIVEGLEVTAPRLELRDPVPRPPRGRPRIFALPIESPGTVALQAALEEKLVAERFYKPEKRPFWPHLTVARVRPEGRGSKRPQRVESPPGAAAGRSRRTYVRFRPSLSLPFRTQAPGCAVHAAGPCRSVPIWAAAVR